ncbi:NmrA family protein [Thioalkalivibrio nitratireducens DSM 14787]|uniref:NmrA family protein n=1 Tax=Thioalkalivibrio nitratireducens (strain DSM 14787 / UNIQEM 213 / ALEN2) TaxID=1255043 RepID=L0DWI9_THIND|nr:NAD(P)H-binding protein [Thioalkalivibrio nitratireducens]AGA33959.1 NmrA family protein [Thioalkalivibrio nitratireducens DSM 14787]
MKRTDLTTETTLVLSGTGKTGRRIVERLSARGLPVRVGSRSGRPPFDWEDRETWAPAVLGVTSAYLAYFPDLAVPGAAATVGSFAELAVASGVRRLVLLSGRGEEGAQLAEHAVRRSGADWTVLRSSWFCQNFSEGSFLDMVLAGEVALPAGSVAEPFVDLDDVADVAVAALTESGHAGHIYELTGPQLLTFAEAVEQIARATGRQVDYVQISMEQFVSALAEQGEPEAAVALLSYLFSEVLDGRNAQLGDGVQRALGRVPRAFSDYARDAAASGAWQHALTPAHRSRVAEYRDGKETRLRRPL